jgi:hypothetical protein
MNSAWRTFGRRSACADRKVRLFASAEADAWRGVCRMNSASRGLRPTVGLRRPKVRLLRRRRPTPGAQRLRRPISIGVKACADRKSASLASAEAEAAKRRKKAISIGMSRRLARAPGKDDFNRREETYPGSPQSACHSVMIEEGTHSARPGPPGRAILNPARWPHARGGDH